MRPFSSTSSTCCAVACSSVASANHVAPELAGLAELGVAVLYVVLADEVSWEELVVLEDDSQSQSSALGNKVIKYLIETCNIDIRRWYSAPARTGYCIAASRIQLAAAQSWQIGWSVPSAALRCHSASLTGPRSANQRGGYWA